MDGLGCCFGFLGSPYERDYYLGGTPIRIPKKTGPQTTNLPLVEVCSPKKHRQGAITPFKAPVKVTPYRRQKIEYIKFALGSNTETKNSRCLTKHVLI